MTSSRFLTVPLLIASLATTSSYAASAGPKLEPFARVAIGEGFPSPDATVALLVGCSLSTSLRGLPTPSEVPPGSTVSFELTFDGPLVVKHDAKQRPGFSPLILPEMPTHSRDQHFNAYSTVRFRWIADRSAFVLVGEQFQ